MVSETATPVRKPRGRTPRRSTKPDETPRSTTKGRKPKAAAAVAVADVLVASPVKTPKNPGKSPGRGRSRSPGRSVKKPAAASTPKPRKPRTPSRTRTTKANSPKQSKASSPLAESVVVNSIKSAGGDQPEGRQTRKRAARATVEQAGSAEKRKKLDLSTSSESGQLTAGRSWWSCSLM